MRPAEPQRRTFWMVLGGVLAAALALRLYGLTHGLPYVYNADENAHFVPRAIGMFDHSYNPGYFINPPAFTYLLHVVFWARWGGDGVQDAYAGDPGDVFALARAMSALLGTLAVGLLAWAGTRMFDRRVALVAAAVLAVAFLPVHYSHLALNDVPTLAPLCLALVGVAGILRDGRMTDYLIAGGGLGLACATKYTAGIVLLCLLAAAVRSPRAARATLAGLAAAGATAMLAFAIANPYALIDFDAFLDGLNEQSAASNDGGGKLGLTEPSGIVYYLKSLGWGLGLLPAVAVLGGAWQLARRDRGAALVLATAPVLFVLFMGSQDRFFARWLIPIYPLLCLLAAVGAVALFDWFVMQQSTRVRRLAPAFAAAILCAQGVVFSVHNVVVLARDDTRQVARDWMVSNVPEGSKVVVEPIAPDQWAMDPGRPSPTTGNGNRWIKWRTSRSRVNNDGTIRTHGIGRRVKLEDYERTTRPELLDSYERGGFCWVVTGSTQFGRAFAEPREVPSAIRYYDELRERGEVVYRVTPYDEGAASVPFSFDYSFNSYPLAYARPGPEIIIYRLRGGDCA